MNFQKTRFAPTPSGFLHIGNLYSFLVTNELAKKSGAKILLRIDDLDRERVKDEYLQDVFDSLEFAGLDWHEGPRNVPEFENRFSQLKRLSLYESALEKLKTEGKLYACSCSRSKIYSENHEGIYNGECRNKHIAFEGKEVCWRLKTSPDKKIKIRTLGAGLIETTLPAEMNDFIVRKKDGFPSYQLSSLVDDVHFGIDLVVRGLDLWNSSLAQLYLAEELGFNKFLDASFHHHDLISAKNGNKLSKSAGDTSIQFLRKQGKKLPEILAEMPRVTEQGK